MFGDSIKNILLIESNVNHQALYTIMLGRAIKCNTILVSNTIEACSYLRRTRPDIVIIGANIDKDSSIELLKFVKNASRTSNVPVLKITAPVTKVDLVEFITLGIDNVLLTSDFNPQTFIPKVHELLDDQYIAKMPIKKPLPKARVT